MTKYIRLLLVLSLIAGCVSCAKTGTVMINFERKANTGIEVTMEYLVLDVPDCLVLGPVEQIECDDDYIYILSSVSGTAGVYVFDKVKGSYVGKIGRIGNGPDEYLLPFSFTVLEDCVCIVDGGKSRVLEYAGPPFRFISSYDIPDIGGFVIDSEGVIMANVLDPTLCNHFSITTSGNESKTVYKVESNGSGYVTGPLKPLYEHDGHVHAYVQHFPVIYELKGETLMEKYHLSFNGLDFPDKSYIRRISSGKQNYFKLLERSGYISYYDCHETDDVLISMCIVNSDIFLGVYSKSSGEAVLYNEDELNDISISSSFFIAGVIDCMFAVAVPGSEISSGKLYNEILGDTCHKISDNDIIIQMIMFKSDSFFEANVEALANYETGGDCHYVNGYTPCGRRCSSI